MMRHNRTQSESSNQNLIDMSLTKIQTQNIRDKVLEIIRAKPECRTNKRQLLANYLFDECKRNRFNNVYEFLLQYAQANTTDVESILRIHRLVVSYMDNQEGKIHDFKKDEQNKVVNDLREL